jgi:uncharacterized protein (DUF433 family)
MTGVHEPAAMNEALIALARDRAAEVAGLTQRQVDYWASTGLVQPTVDRRLSPQRPVRLYGYVDLMSLMVAAELRRRGVSLQNVRRIVGHLRDRGYPRPLTQIVFATIGTNVYFQLEDGTWEGGAQPTQIVMHEVLDLEPLRARLGLATRRDDDAIGHIERRRGAMGSKPLVAGTRVPVATVERYLQRGASTDEVIRAFPLLTPRDVEMVRQHLRGVVA